MNSTFSGQDRFKATVVSQGDLVGCVMMPVCGEVAVGSWRHVLCLKQIATIMSWSFLPSRNMG